MLNKCGLNTENVVRTNKEITAIAVITVDSKGFLTFHLQINQQIFRRKLSSYTFGRQYDICSGRNTKN